MSETTEVRSRNKWMKMDIERMVGGCGGSYVEIKNDSSFKKIHDLYMKHICVLPTTGEEYNYFGFYADKIRHDIDLAMEFYSHGAALGDVHALNNLAKCFYKKDMFDELLSLWIRHYDNIFKKEIIVIICELWNKKLTDIQYADLTMILLQIDITSTDIETLKIPTTLLEHIKLLKQTKILSKV